MNWTTLLRGGIEYNYAVAERLMDMVSDSELGWKPATGSNWMTVGQLLHHMTDACGMCCKGFVTGDWGFPPDIDINNIPPEMMLPPAEKLPTVSSVAEAKAMLAADKKTALEMLTLAGEERLDKEISKAPWDTEELPLGQRLLEMVGHLKQHKGQLFYYLKLQGKPVNTNDLYGA
ncbi:MAG: DinB family protein [Calditrichaeota bacterium]|nr:DinB family protein [Calditrichota bacterium]